MGKMVNDAPPRYITVAGYRLDTDRPRLIVTFLPGQLSTTWAGHVLCSYSTDGTTRNY